MEINFPNEGFPGRGKLSPKVTDEGAGKQQLPGKYPSSGAMRHLPPKGGRLLLRGKLQKLISVPFSRFLLPKNDKCAILLP